MSKTKKPQAPKQKAPDSKLARKVFETFLEDERFSGLGGNHLELSAKKYSGGIVEMYVSDALKETSGCVRLTDDGSGVLRVAAERDGITVPYALSRIPHRFIRLPNLLARVMEALAAAGIPIRDVREGCVQRRLNDNLPATTTFKMDMAAAGYELVNEHTLSFEDFDDEDEGIVQVRAGANEDWSVFLYNIRTPETALAVPVPLKPRELRLLKHYSDSAMVVALLAAARSVIAEWKQSLQDSETSKTKVTK
jgi:hypothetical protein